MDRPSFSAIPQTIQEKYDATIVMSVTITATNKVESHILILQSNTTKKVALLLDLEPIEFDQTVEGQDCWVEEWGILKDTPCLLIGTHNSTVLDIYDFSGRRVGITYTQPSGVSETLYFIGKEYLEYTETPFLLRFNPFIAKKPKIVLQ